MPDGPSRRSMRIFVRSLFQGAAAGILAAACHPASAHPKFLKSLSITRITRTATSAATNVSSFNRRMPARWLKVRSVRRDPAASSYRSAHRGDCSIPSLNSPEGGESAASLRARSASQSKPGSFSHDREVCAGWHVVVIRYGEISTTLWAIAASLAAALVIGLSPRPAVSLPLYARQTGQPCATCHTAFLELTPFGRRFKLGGYTLSGGDWTGPPFAVMLQAPTYTHTEAGQEGGAAPHFGPNNNFAFQQASLFTGGRFADNLGAFIQGTYDGVTRRFSWDNTDIRFAKSINVDGHNLLWGITTNNNPTVQDVWNTIPAWSFPYISSALAPTPTAKTFIDQVFAQQVAGVSAYAFLDDLFYLEFGGYRPLSTNTQKALGVDTIGQSPISGVAPYWRAAIEPNFGDHS